MHACAAASFCLYPKGPLPGSRARAGPAAALAAARVRRLMRRLVELRCDDPAARRRGFISVISVGHGGDIELIVLSGGLSRELVEQGTRGSGVAVRGLSVTLIVMVRAAGVRRSAAFACDGPGLGLDAQRQRGAGPRADSGGLAVTGSDIIHCPRGLMRWHSECSLYSELSSRPPSSRPTYALAPRPDIGTTLIRTMP